MNYSVLHLLAAAVGLENEENRHQASLLCVFALRIYVYIFILTRTVSSFLFFCITRPPSRASLLMQILAQSDGFREKLGM